MSNANNANADLRLIEDYLPIEAISKEASREKSVRKGHISTLHLWWARRPLVACRAAVYASLVPADRWVKDVDLKNPPADAAKAEKITNGKKKGLNRKAARDFVTKLCRYPKTNPTKPADIKLKRETEAAIVEAQRHILEAHADRLTRELVEALKLPLPFAGEGWAEGAPSWLNEFEWPPDKTVVTYDDIVAGRAPRPRVLDMFAGGGAIPLEALRLGCEAYALDLNPVAHIIQLCTLVYPQKYGKPDPAVRGMTGPPMISAPSQGGDTEGVVRSWGGLAAEVRYWGNWVLERVRKEIGDLYPLISDPHYKPGKDDVDAPTKGASGKQIKMQVEEDDNDPGNAKVPPGYLMPVAYLWTRTVRCKNPTCGATVPLVRQTWLCKKDGRYAALRVLIRKDDKRVAFKAVESDDEAGLGFDPEEFSIGGNATCPFCGTVADNNYVKSEGMAQRLSLQLMAVACLPRRGTLGKVYLGDADVDRLTPDPVELAQVLSGLIAEGGITVPDEPLPPYGTLGFRVQPYGLKTWGDLFTTRQQASLVALCAAVRDAAAEMPRLGSGASASEAVHLLLSSMVDRIADFNSVACVFNYTGGRGVVHTFGRHALPMVWDFAESNVFNPEAASWPSAIADVPAAIETFDSPLSAVVTRGSATSLPFADEYFDGAVTDPPYYDNIPYADLSDFFYVWLKRSLGGAKREHFSSLLTPKKNEAIAEPMRHDRNHKKAFRAYEEMMFNAFCEARRTLKSGASLSVVYAHKTTMGWATLVDALRKAGFTVTEAWPLDTEKTGRLRAQDSAALASSITLVARKRAQSAGAGKYDLDVQPELHHIVRERVETLWEMGIAGADLVIACVGAGLRAFTKYEKVEYANGEEVPAAKFLAEVEGVVLDSMMDKLSGVTGGKLSAVDAASRFYVLWRFVYKIAEIDAGEAIVFTYAQHVELDGPQGLSDGKHALVEKKKAKYRARDYTERGDDTKLGQPSENGQPAPLIDALHRILWLIEHSPRKLNEFLDDARPDRERLRVLAQALAGAALSGKSEEESAKLVCTTPAEQAALGKLLANWRSLIDEGAAAAVVGKKAAKQDKVAGQMPLDYGEGGRKSK
ncbi:MAG: DUF1156 domain-containing protein [Phycisphaerales bacterium]|nr:DUF1156 domain-containing protein [Phycisphaerales bacterium]